MVFAAQRSFHFGVERRKNELHPPVFDGLSQLYQRQRRRGIHTVYIAEIEHHRLERLGILRIRATDALADVGDQTNDRSKNR